ncbi:class I SAM-dependent methyltransferase [Streptomyces sp. W16]|uniref:class I SAM-dependent methyltransferase n=1 Tax=Streptomyces sp. W16 TaxID=3076631 RepID=UPI00295ACC5F|nr:class I SAM-dependent methyltransferase [Streptomyces sp. W16]MDV9178616.1 class I SAM-dependent methyltransferase [Streptomyces sp. W16]
MSRTEHGTAAAPTDTDHLETKGGQFFARYYDALTKLAEDRWAGRLREAAIGGLTGRVLEVGAGFGANLPYYRSASELVALEPSSEMLRQLRAHRDQSPVPVEIVDGAAEELPFPDASFDAVVTTLVLCSVSDLPLALAEIKRVLKPGGRLAFIEHVRADGLMGHFQDLVAPLWRRLALGCNANWRIAEAVRAAGYHVEVHETLRPWPRYPANAPYIRATARPVEGEE